VRYRPAVTEPVTAAPPRELLPPRAFAFRIPIALAVSAGIWLVWRIASLVLADHAWFVERGTELELVNTGVYFAVSVMFFEGMRELHRRSHGRARQALAAAVAIAAIELAAWCTDGAASMSSGAWVESYWRVMGPAWPWLELAGALALAVAAWQAGPRARIAAALLVVATFVTLPPAQLRETIQAALPGGATFGLAMFTGRLIVMLVTASFIVRASAIRMPDPLVVTRSLRGMAASMGLRLWAIAGLAVTTVFAALSASGGDGMMSFMRFAVVSSQVIAVGALVWFCAGSLGLVRSVRDGEHRGWLAASASLTLVGIGIMATQAAWLVRLMYGNDDTSRLGRDAMSALPICTPALIAAGVVGTMHAIGRIARARDEHETARSMSASATGFVILTSLAVGLQVYALPQQDTNNSILAVLVVSATAGVVGLWAVRRAFRDAAERFAFESSLPVATATLRAS
jgi:hypothetical protein